jgi:DNA-binding transcriptional MerR regulator
MADGKLSIGQVSKRTGIPVKTLRFWSDEGLVPPSGRTDSGYRLYSEADLAKIDLVRTLRDAGLGLDAIGAVLRRELSLADVMRIRLTAIEAHITSLRNVAAALRAALRSAGPSGQPSEQELRRLQAVTNLSNDERRATIQRFYEQVADGLPVDKGWTNAMVNAIAPNLPDEPTTEQLDAWIELSTILADPAFVASMKKVSQETWTPDFDVKAYQRVSDVTVAAAKEAMAAGESTTSPRAGEIVEDFITKSAPAWKRQPDAAFRADMKTRFANHDARASRIWELVATMKGSPAVRSKVAEWNWLVDAIKAAL